MVGGPHIPTAEEVAIAPIAVVSNLTKIFTKIIMSVPHPVNAAMILLKMSLSRVLSAGVPTSIDFATHLTSICNHISVVVDPPS